MLRGLLAAVLVVGFARTAFSAEPDTTVVRLNRPRPTASAPT